MKLERLLKTWGNWGRREARRQLSQGLVKINGTVVKESAFLIAPFDRVEWKDEVIQNRVARSLMLHKPLGVVSATKDAEYQTVIDLVNEEWAEELHLAGRLDRFTTGLMILTNDSRLSEKLTEPSEKLGKRYRVSCDSEIREEMVVGFKEGLWFAKEGITTQPAEVELLSSTECLLTIYEGKHHQVKRMFARFEVKVTALHREAMGPLELAPSLLPSEWRLLTEEELALIKGSP